MMKRVSLFLCVLFLCGVAVSSFAADKVLLQYNNKPGTTVKYKLHLQGTTTVAATGGEAMKTDLETDVALDLKVTGVDKNGNIEMASTITEGTITVNKVPTPLPAIGQVNRIKMTKSGEVLESEGMGQQNNLAEMQVKFPEKPIGIGETWDAEIKPNPQMPIALKVKYTLIGFEAVDGKECAILQTNIVSDAGETGSLNFNVKADGKIWFSHKDGIIIKNEVTTTMNMIMENDIGGGKKNKIETRMNLNLKMGIAK